MRTAIVLGLVLAIVASASLARAWDGDPLWYNPANGKVAQPYNVMPGGGGIIGTGGAGDHAVTCAHCHIKGDASYGTIRVSFNPPFGTTYMPNKQYTVTLNLVGEHLGLSGCGQYVLGNINEFAATFETDSGKVAGAMQADYGSTASCPTTPPPMGFTGATMMYGDCHAIIAATVKDKTSWTFKWTAPPPGAGNVTFFYGVVDGDCMMDSLKDDVKVGSVTMSEGVMMMAPPRPPNDPASTFSSFSSFGLAVPAIGLVVALRRRRKRG